MRYSLFHTAKREKTNTESQTLSTQKGKVEQWEYEFDLIRKKHHILVFVHGRSQVFYLLFFLVYLICNI